MSSNSPYCIQLDICTFLCWSATWESEKEYDDSRDPSYLIGFCGKDQAKTMGYLSVEWFNQLNELWFSNSLDLATPLDHRTRPLQTLRDLVRVLTTMKLYTCFLHVISFTEIRYIIIYGLRILTRIFYLMGFCGGHKRGFFLSWLHLLGGPQ
jgi:hypothetical protein